MIMKNKLAAAAGGLACFFATAMMPIHAEETYTAVSGSSFNLPEGAGSVVHTVSIPVKENGKKFNKDATTVITRQKTSLVGFAYCGNDPHVLGQLFEYESADSVLTLPNGDLVATRLDPEKESIVCTFPSHFEVTLYTRVIGGSGDSEGVCGWQKTTLTGEYLNLTPGQEFFAVEGTTVGEIFRDSDCPL
jgi:hypothetical protein